MYILCAFGHSIVNGLRHDTTSLGSEDHHDPETDFGFGAGTF